MSEQPLDLKRSMGILRRHWLAVLVPVLVGLLGGAAYTVLKPPMFVASAQVELPVSTRDISTQVIVADSEPVLNAALRKLGLQMSFLAFRNRVQTMATTPDILSISGQGSTAAEADRIANDVAASYVSYAATKSGGNVSASVLQPAILPSTQSLLVRVSTTVGFGALIGAVVGAMSVLAWYRRDRRPRSRDAIADTIGAPVVASLPVLRPKDATGWIKLLDSYQPNAVHAWRLRNVLQYLGVYAPASAREGHGACSVTVLSLSTDRRALALGPQLAVFAASQGIPTSLLIGPEQEADAAAALRAACRSQPPSSRSSRLRLVLDEQGTTSRFTDAALTVVVAVVETRAPRRADNWRTSATILGVSAGGATEEQLVKAAASAAADGREIDAIMVADPDPHDNTTGRFPQVRRLDKNHHVPTRVTKMTGEMG